MEFRYDMTYNVNRKYVVVVPRTIFGVVVNEDQEGREFYNSGKRRLT
jgi:hypothetical protein